MKNKPVPKQTVSKQSENQTDGAFPSDAHPMPRVLFRNLSLQRMNEMGNDHPSRSNASPNHTDPIFSNSPTGQSHHCLLVQHSHGAVPL